MDIDQLALEVTYSAVMSRGPGGQNVNKVSSAAQLSWDAHASSLLNQEQRAQVLEKLSNRINSEGVLIVRCDEYRDLPRNKERALKKLYHLILLAITKPKPRRPTKPTKASKKRRMDSKSRRGETKKSRQKVKI